MTNKDWDPQEIKRLALSSGKPLEVHCARSFSRAHWLAFMGTHYAQAGTATNRELDIFAVKQMAVQVDGKSLTCQLRALISVRGFPPAMSPIAYSTADSLQKLNINLLGSYEGPRDNYTQAVRDLLIYLGRLGAQQLLRSASLISSRPYCRSIPSSVSILIKTVFLRSTKESEKATEKSSLPWIAR